MRHGTSNRRQRNRNNNGRRNNNQQQRTQVYDSNGPDVRIRGTAHQVAEKYLTLAKDATSSGDHIVAENYFQHAEHYIRLINEVSGGPGPNKISNARKNDSLSDDAGNMIEKSDAAKDVEDLSLPASILGEAKEDAPKVEEDAVE
ncbi:MAG: DUF4167 domain-containing protein [Alphaproteobacteria bacterium]